MPIDPDEESLPGLAPPTGKPIAPAVPKATEGGGPAAGLPWGVCGVLHEAGELSAHPGARGVTRYVADGVRFTAPPLALPYWKPIPGKADSYQMPWPDNPAQARTLTGFRRELEDAARSGRLRKGTDPLLNELNHLSVRLCDLAESLQRSRWSLGLIQPANVVLKATPDGPEPVPVDLGFTWKGSFGPPPWDASPGKPSWLDAAGTDWLYDTAAVRRQFADPADSSFPPAEPIADVRVLGRLFAWLLTGSRDADVRAPARSTAPELWRLLAAAAAGQVAEVREFRDHLRENPLSDHFTDPVVLAPPPPVKVPATGSAALIPLLGVGLLGLLALGAGGAYFAGVFNKPQDTATAVTVPIADVATPSTDKPITVPTMKDAPPPIVPAEFAKLMEDLTAALKKKDGKTAAEKLLDAERLGKLPTKETAQRDKQRDEFLNVWYADFAAIRKTWSDMPGEKARLILPAKVLETRLKTLTDEYPTPAANASLHKKERQCLQNVSDLLRDLGYSP